MKQKNLLETRKETELELSNKKERFRKNIHYFKLQTNAALATEPVISFQKLMLETNTYHYKDEAPFIQSLEAALAHDKISKDWQFSSNIAVIANFIETIQEQTNMLDVTQKDPVLILMEHDSATNEMQFLILTADDAATFAIFELDSKQGSKTFWIETVHQIPFWGEKPVNLPKAYGQGLQEIALFAGDTDILNSTYDKDCWLAENSRDKLNFMQQYILPQHPDKLNLLDRLKKTMDAANAPATVAHPRAVLNDSSSEEKEALHNTEPIEPKPFFIARRPSIHELPKILPKGPKDLSRSEKAQVKENINQMVLTFIKVNNEILSKEETAAPIKNIIRKLNEVCEIFYEMRNDSYQDYYNRYFIMIEKLLFLTDCVAKLKGESPQLNAFIKTKFLPHFGDVLKEEKIDMKTISTHIKNVYRVNTGKIHSLDKLKTKSLSLKFIQDNQPKVYADILNFKNDLDSKRKELYDRLQKIPHPTQPEKVQNYHDKLSVLFKMNEVIEVYLSGLSPLSSISKVLEEQLEASQKIAHVGWRHSILGSDSDTTGLLKQLQTALKPYIPQQRKLNF